MAPRRMAYTLQVGREAMDERLALIVNALEELERKLDAFVAEAGMGHGWTTSSAAKSSTGKTPWLPLEWTRRCKRLSRVGWTDARTLGCWNCGSNGLSIDGARCI